MYPSISDKAAFYMFSIVTGHVFQDGNKLTGLEAALLFLKMNGFQLMNDLIQVNIDEKFIPETGSTSHKILENFTLEMAGGIINSEACKAWFHANVITITNNQ